MATLIWGALFAEIDRIWFCVYLKICLHPTGQKFERGWGGRVGLVSLSVVCIYLYICVFVYLCTFKVMYICTGESTGQMCERRTGGFRQSLSRGLRPGWPPHASHKLSSSQEEDTLTVCPECPVCQERTHSRWQSRVCQRSQTLRCDKNTPLFSLIIHGCSEVRDSDWCSRNWQIC